MPSQTLEGTWTLQAYINVSETHLKGLWMHGDLELQGINILYGVKLAVLGVSSAC